MGVGLFGYGIRICSFLLCLVLTPSSLYAQQLTDRARDYLSQSVGLTTQELESISAGEPVVKIQETEDRAEVIMFGAVYVDSTPEAFVELYRDLDQLGENEEYLGIGAFQNPPRSSDLRQFTLAESDFDDLRKCKVGDCNVQLSADGIEAVEKIDWSAANAEAQVNQLFREGVLKAVVANQQQGNEALGIYMNKDYALDVDKTFRQLLSRVDGLAGTLPDLYQYLTGYPNAELSNHEDYFYWEKVSFGVKPTLRVNHVVIQDRSELDRGGIVVVNKQLWASHYFQSAFDLWLCVEDEAGPAKKGFFLVTFKGSRQNALVKGLIGRMVRSRALPRAQEGVSKALGVTKSVLEAE